MHRHSTRPSTNSSRMTSATRGRARPGDRLMSAPPMKSGFEFAKIPYIEIQEDLKDIVGRKIPLEELKAPTTELILEVFWSFVVELLHCKPQDLAQPPFEVLEQIDRPELYDENVHVTLGFMRYAQRLMDIAQLGEFTLRDLFAPEKTRFHMQLSALVNLLRYRILRLGKFEENVQNLDAEINEEKALRERKTVLEQNIAKVEAEREREKPELERINKAIDEESLVLSAHHRQQNVLTEKTRERKELLAKLVSELQRKKANATELNKEVSQMDSKVVPSPDRVRSELDAMADKVDQERDYIESVQLRTKQLLVREEAVDKALTQMEQLNNVHDNTIERLKVMLHIKGNSERLKTKNSKLEKQVRASSQLKQQLEREIAVLDARNARIEEQKRDVIDGKRPEDIKREEVEKQFESTLESFRRTRKEEKEKVDKIQKEIVSILESHRAEMQKVLEKKKFMYENLSKFKRDTLKSMTIIAENDVDQRKQFDEMVSSRKEGEKKDKK